MKTLINKDKVSHIYIHKAYKSHWNYKWREGWWSKFLWLIPEEYNKPGYYSEDWGIIDPYYEIPNDMFDKDGYLYDKPTMFIYCGKECIRTICKDTVEELLCICEDKFDNVNVEIR